MYNISGKKKKWLIEEIAKLNREGVSKAEVARRLGIMPQQLNNILNGSRGITDDFLNKFIATFELNQLDLYSMLLPNPEANSIYKRIIAVLTDMNITVSEFQKLQTGYKHIFDNALNFDDPKTAKGWAKAIVEKYPRYSLDWILTGEGNMTVKGNGNSLDNSGIIIGDRNINLGNIDFDNRHYYSDSPDVLRTQIDMLEKELKDKLAVFDERIKEKDAQIKEKDAQIKQLLDILQKK